jgi:hypothetical protein
MTHVLPLLDDLPLARLLKLRREERDSFARYRLAVGRILNEVAQKKKRIGKREVRELFQEQVEPELAKMRSELHHERRRQLRRIVGGVGAMAASLALGAYGKIAPLAAGSIGAAFDSGSRKLNGPLAQSSRHSERSGDPRRVCFRTLPREATPRLNHRRATISHGRTSSRTRRPTHGFSFSGGARHSTLKALASGAKSRSDQG